MGGHLRLQVRSGSESTICQEQMGCLHLGSLGPRSHPQSAQSSPTELICKKQEGQREGKREEQRERERQGEGQRYPSGCCALAFCYDAHNWFDIVAPVTIPSHVLCRGTPTPQVAADSTGGRFRVGCCDSQGLARCHKHPGGDQGSVRKVGLPQELHRAYQRFFYRSQRLQSYAFASKSDIGKRFYYRKRF